MGDQQLKPEQIHNENKAGLPNSNPKYDHNTNRNLD